MVNNTPIPPTVDRYTTDSQLQHISRVLTDTLDGYVDLQSANMSTEYWPICRLTYRPILGRHIPQERRLTEVFTTHDPQILLNIIDWKMKLLNSFPSSTLNTWISYLWTIGKASKSCTETFQFLSFKKMLKSGHDTSFIHHVLVSMLHPDGLPQCCYINCFWFRGPW